MKTSHKGFIVPLLLIIIAILVVVGGAYVFTQTKQTNQSTVVIPSAQQTQPMTTIQNPALAITVIYPNGGEVLQAGSAQTVKWNGGQNPLEIMLETYTEGELVVAGWIATNVSPTPGQYIWKVGEIFNKSSSGTKIYKIAPAGKYFIRVNDFKTGNLGRSDALFTIATSISFPPNGWYVHNFDTSIMLTKQKTLPNCQGTEGACYGEQIDIHISSITLTPEQYIAKIIQDGVFPSVQKWDTMNGHKTFSMTYTTEANSVPTDAEYILVGNTVYQFALYPSAEKDRADFQQVVKYYSIK